MSRYWIGIDPGSSNGGIAVLEDSGKVVMTCKCPDTDKDILIALEPYSPTRGNIVDETTVCIEKLWGHDGMMGSKASVFTQGRNYGMLQMACVAMELEMYEIPPAKWQKYYGINKEKGITPKAWKAVLKDKAQKLFPTEKITLWSADALLIAKYCMQTQQRPVKPTDK